MLRRRMTAYHMCPVSLFLSLALVDLGPLQHLRWNTLWENSTFGSWKSLLLKRSILYKCSVWVSLAVSYSMMIQLTPFYIVSVSLF